MKTQFVKIYGEQLLNSTLWLECWQARMTFIGMLAAADYEGFCGFPSVAALAHRLNLPVEEVKKGLEVLEAPDPESRSKAEEGRRVVRTDGGWQLVNYARYREARTRAQVLGAERVKRHYEKHGRVRSVSDNEITPDLRSRIKKEKREESVAPDGAPASRATPRKREKPKAQQALEAALADAMRSRGDVAPSMSNAIAQKASGRVREYAEAKGVSLGDAAALLAASWVERGNGNAWRLTDVPFTAQGAQRAFSGPSRGCIAPSPGTTHEDFAHYPSVEEQMKKVGM